MGLIFIVLFAVWIALTRSTDPYIIGTGVIVVIGVILVQRYLFPRTTSPVRRMLRRPHRMIAFFAILLANFASSTIYTCRLILSGREEGRFITLPVKVDDPLAQFILFNSITLTPSTIAILCEENLLYVHWLQEKGNPGDWRTIKESLEERLIIALEGGIDVHH